MITKQQSTNLLWLATEWAEAQSKADSYKTKPISAKGEYILALQDAAEACYKFKEALEEVTA